jgi:hypothetical protein
VSGLPVRRAAQLQPTEPERRWLIEGLWCDGAVGIIGGEPKCCKSFLALGMAVALTSGRPCLGRFAVPRTGRVLLYAAEDALHIVRERLDGICAWYGVDIAALDLWVITAPSLRLDHEHDCEQLFETVKALEPALLVLDPFVRLHRIDENQSAAVAPLLASLRTLQRRFGCAVAVVHHARKSAHKTRAGQSLRGSSEFHAWGDSNLYMHRNGAALAMSIEHRAWPSPADPVGLQLDVRDDAVALVAFGAGDDVAAGPRGDGADAELTPRSRVVDALRAAGCTLRLRELRARCRMRAETLTATLRDLVDSGEVRRDDDGWSIAPPAAHTAAATSTAADPPPRTSGTPLLPFPESTTP